MPAEVILVCGPPCAGKSTWVERRRSGADVVIDLDEIERFAGSRHAARMVRAEMEQQVAEMTSGRVFVVRSLATREARESAAAFLGASRVHVLLADRDELLSRAAHRPHGTVEVIDRWLDDYEPSLLDSPT